MAMAMTNAMESEGKGSKVAGGVFGETDVLTYIWKVMEPARGCFCDLQMCNNKTAGGKAWGYDGVWKMEEEKSCGLRYIS
jgi:hypothetical protein